MSHIMDTSRQPSIAHRRTRAVIALVFLVLALGRNQWMRLLASKRTLHALRLSRQHRLPKLSHDEALEQLYYETKRKDGTYNLLVPDHGRYSLRPVTPTNEQVYRRDFDAFSLPPPVSQEASQERRKQLSYLGGISKKRLEALRTAEAKVAPKEGESVSSASAMRVGVDREFFRQLRALFRVMVPNSHTREVYVFLLHTFFLVMRTYLSLLVARLDGYIVKALISADRKSFVRGLGLWFALSVPATYTNAMIRFLQSKLSIGFRTRLTRYVHDLYLNAHQNFYKVMNLDNRLEAVSQYITHDIAQFCDVLADLYSNISKPVLDIIIFLWQIGTSLGLRGILGIAAGYYLGSLSLRAVSPPFGKLAAIEAKLEGQYHNAHSRLIINAEEVAFYNGASTEEGILQRLYKDLAKHIQTILRLRIGYSSTEDFVLKYSWSAIGYMMMAIPSFSAQRKGGSTAEADPAIAKQTESYISNRRLLLSLADAGSRLMYSYKGVAELAGQTSRVYSLISTLHLLNHNVFQSVPRPDDFPADKTFYDLGSITGKVEQGHEHVRFAHAPIVTPAPGQPRGGEPLVQDFNLTVNPGDHIMVTGPNGVGKTAVARILAGLWPVFDGLLEKPDDRDMIFLPQRPYLTSESLREQIMYPTSYAEHVAAGRTDEELMDILRHVHLAYLPAREGGWTTRKEWKDVLSGGEKQRMGMARMFYHRPRYAVLDECTSAVSSDVEGLMYAHAKEIGITLITISHRPSLFKYHKLLLDIKGDEKYEVINLAGDTQELTFEQELTDLEDKVKQVDDWKKRLEEINKELAFGKA